MLSFIVHNKKHTALMLVGIGEEKWPNACKKQWSHASWLIIPADISPSNHSISVCMCVFKCNNRWGICLCVRHCALMPDFAVNSFRKEIAAFYLKQILNHHRPQIFGRLYICRTFMGPKFCLLFIVLYIVAYLLWLKIRVTIKILNFY